jgi:hypothetical protein
MSIKLRPVTILIHAMRPEAAQYGVLCRHFLSVLNLQRAFEFHLWASSTAETLCLPPLTKEQGNEDISLSLSLSLPI